MHRNFAMQPAAEKSFYLRLTVKKMHAFAVFIEQYLQPYGCSSTNFTAVVWNKSEIIEIQNNLDVNLAAFNKTNI